VVPDRRRPQNASGERGTVRQINPGRGARVNRARSCWSSRNACAIQPGVGFV
jgi:hypothetical protein